MPAVSFLGFIAGFLTLACAPSHFAFGQASNWECGVYAMAAAAGALDVEVDLRLIERGTFVGPKGSSVSQLRALATELGLWSRGIDNVSVEYVRASEHPLILNLRISTGVDQAGHWVTFLGCSHDRAILFDNVTSNKLCDVSMGELALMMTGEAIEVSRSPPTLVSEFRQISEALLGMWIGLIIPCVGLLVSTNSQAWNCLEFRSRWKLDTPMRQSIFVLGIGLITGVFVYYTSPTGLFQNPSATAWVQSKHLAEDLPVVGFQQLMQMLRNTEIAVVDARPSWLFDAGHIPGAVNCPIDSRPDAVWKFAATLREKRAIFVYCSTEKCEWDKVVAWRLKATGLPDVRVYEEGVVGFIRQSNDRQN
jgi:rhodanese-related sulfurtransferase